MKHISPKTLWLRKQLLITTQIFLVSFSVFAQNPKLISNPISSGSGKSIQKIITVKDGKAFFNTIDNNNHFSQLWGLWFTDGTNTGTKKIILKSPPYPGSSAAGFVSTEATILTPLGNDKIIFAGDNENGYGEVWVSDGTEAGTFVLEQFFGSTTQGPPVSNITSFGNSVIYSVITNDNKLQLHKTDGSYAGTSMVYDFGDYTNVSVSYFKTIDNFVYFELNNNSTKNNEIWRTDGTVAGTYQIKDLGLDYGFASDFMSFKNNIYFITISSTFGDYIWKSDGTNAGTVKLKQISTSFQYENLFPSYAAVENAMILANNLLYFTANDGTHGKELWKTDGTPSGTGMILDLSPGTSGSNPGSLSVLNSELYFAANSSLYPAGNELYKYNGSQFSQPIETWPGINSGNPAFLTLQNNTLLFSAQRNTTIPRLFVSDGTEPNTIEISESFSNPQNISVLGNIGFFVANADINRDGLDEPCVFKYTVPDKIWTGNVNTDVSNIDNWFPSGVPSETDNVLISPSAKNNITNPSYLICNDLINNGGKIIMQNGLLLLNGDLYNEGIIDNSVPGVFGIIGNTRRNHSVGSPGAILGQLTASSNVTMHLTSNVSLNALRIEGADSIYLGDYQMQVNNYPIFIPTYVTDGTGMLFLPVGSSPVTFSLVNPVTITNNGTPDYFGVGVHDGILKNGTSGDTVKTQGVNKTWDIVKETGGPVNINLSVQWKAIDELPDFDRSNVYLNHFTNNAWDAGNSGPAIGAGPFSIGRNNITSLSPFSVTSSEGPLPLRLISFSGRIVNGLVQLEWQTASEQNTSLFSIQKSDDGLHFSEIGKVMAAGNSAENKNYFFTDPGKLFNKSFYKIKILDKDGKYNFSRVVIMDNTEGGMIKIYPNPSHDRLFVNLPETTNPILLSVYTIDGKKIMKQKIWNQTSHILNISGLPKGTYHLMINWGASTSHFQFVKE